MQNKKFFIAAPISGYNDDAEYSLQRTYIMNFVAKLDNKYGYENVISALKEIKSTSDYGDTIYQTEKDFMNIRTTDYFILFYPNKVVSSALIELGFALSEKKKIVIISKSKDTLPYMAKELDKIYDNVEILFHNTITKSTFDQILKLID